MVEERGGNIMGFWGEEKERARGFSNTSVQAGIKLAASESREGLVKNRDFWNLS